MRKIFTMGLFALGALVNLNGQVGIGTVDPTKDLDVDGELRIRTLPVASATDNILTADTDGNVTLASTDELKAELSGEPWFLEGSTSSRATANGDKMWHQDFIGIFPNSGNAFDDSNTTNVPVAPLHIKSSINAITLQDHNDTALGSNITMNFIDSSANLKASIYTGVSANGQSANSNITMRSESGNVLLQAGTLQATLNQNTGNFTMNSGAFVPDYVFQKEFDGYSEILNDYERMDLEQVEKYVRMNYHLPGVDSNKKIQKEGLAVDKVLMQVLEKCEELYLHTIELNKRIEALEANQK